MPNTTPLACLRLVQLNYDPRNPFDLCSITFTPIYRGNKVGKGGLCRSREPPLATRPCLAAGLPCLCSLADT